MEELFPITKQVKTKDKTSLIISIFLYIVISGVVSSVIFWVRWIPLFGWILKRIADLIGLYCIVGVVLSILRYNGK